MVGRACGYGQDAVEFGKLVEGVRNGEGSGWMTLAAIPVVGAALVKVLNFLAKLGRG